MANVPSGRWRAKWNHHTDEVTFEQRAAFPDSVWLPAPDIDPNVDLLASYEDAMNEPAPAK